MVLEEVGIFKEFTPVIALIIIMVIGGKWILQKSFDQVELARREFANYIETTGKEHAMAMNKMSENLLYLHTDLIQHTKTKEQFIDITNEQKKTIGELFEMLKEQIKTNRSR